MRSFFYFMARILGDLSAVKRGPKAMVKRVIRKRVYKQVGKILR